MAMQPFTLTEQQKAEVETLAAVLTAEQVADYFGIGRRTFYSMMQRDAEIAARYKRGKAKAIGVIAQGLINKARAGDTTSMIFFLKTQAGWRETSQVEHMLPAEPDITPDSAFQKLTAYLDAIRSRQQGAVLTAESEPLPVRQAGDQDG
jgi:DNA-binding CsgD family transcriptional regulator